MIKNNYYQNAENANIFEYNRQLAKLGKPVDRTEWGMVPQTVNAYYNSSLNEIVFPAAILQPPFFNLKADDAVNYGGIGAVIGHEIGHGFDDEGSTFDGDGVLRNWWTPQDLKAFKAKTNALVEQYNSFKPFPDLHLNGTFTLGENKETETADVPIQSSHTTRLSWIHLWGMELKTPIAVLKALMASKGKFPPPPKPS